MTFLEYLQSGGPVHYTIYGFMALNALVAVGYASLLGARKLKAVLAR